MKTRYILSAMAALLLSFSAVMAQCTFGSSFGSATAGGIGTTVTITTCQYGGEYATISGIVAGETYSVTSSVATDFETIHSLSPSGAVVSFGVQGTSWVAPVSGTYYAHTSTNASCGTASVCRTTSIVHGVIAPSSNCLNTSSFGSATISPTGSLVTISTCSYAGEYSTISGAVAGQTLRFISSAGDYITVRSGTSGGPVIAQGLSPLTFVNTFTGTIYAHWSLPLACGTQATCRTTTVQCTSCTVPPPANDACTAATPITCGSTVTGSTTTATIDAAPTCVTSVDASNSLWYKFIGTGQFITMNTCHSSTNFDTKLHVYTGGCGGLTCVTGNDDYSGCSLASLRSEVQFCSSPGVIYLVRVSGFGTASGNFGLNTSCGAAPTPTISALGSVCVGGASISLFASPAGGTFSGPGVSGSVFSPSAAGVGTHTITYTLCGSSASTTVTVLSAPANDLCVNAFSATVGSYSGNTTCATPDAGLTYCGTAAAFSSGSTGSVWYSIVGDGNQWVATTCNSGTDYDTQLGVYTGSCGALTCVAGNDDIAADGGSCSTGPGTAVFKSRVHFCTTIGQTYYILVHGYSSSAGNYQLDLSTVAGPSVSTSSGSYACGTGVSCFGACDGSASASASGGSGSGYTYLWSNGATTASVSGLCAGTYGVTVTDGAGCQGTGSVTITSPAALVANAGPNATVVVGYPSPDNCTTLNASASGGCGPYSYAWSSGHLSASATVCPTVTTDYTVTVTDINGCTSTDVMRVCAYDLVCGRSGSNPRIQICHKPGTSAMAPMCLPAPSIAAHLGHGDILGPCSGIPACSDDDAGKMAESVESFDLSAYPNPFGTTTSIQFSLGKSADQASLKVFDLRGTLVATLFEGSVNAGQQMTFEFGSSNLSSGIYMARLTTSNGEVQTVKLVMQN